MKLRIVRFASKENGLSRRYELQERVFPFMWRTVTSYADDGSGSRDLDSRVNHDIRFLLTLRRALGFETRFV
jgi:hypothetical protein